jgi:DNA repair protein RadA/Sms
MSDVEGEDIERIVTGMCDPCFGGGLARTSVTLIGGEPGAGKTTAALQIADAICAGDGKGGSVLYLGGEQNAREYKTHAMRVGVKNLSRIQLPKTQGMLLDALTSTLAAPRAPLAIVVDSMSSLTTNPEEEVMLAKRFKEYATSLYCPVLIITHVTKDRDMAGLMDLQHEVDTLALLTIDHEDECDRDPCGCSRRELSVPTKNRFGPSGVVVRFYMTPRGLKLVEE